ncbi:cyclic nucleotide-binding-like protein [Phakopsora pachyrhizi]|uniref:cAMP-dependent protein kinase regulatory subunit n=1 Tax=Phakopsora pachyrhizi TaxID=170000 RepID=A0AAV0AT30_PHAPC|nr:cyclic nucleotide-binding-like protein [Phakopsora pachyrhizi]CAH7671098.1 cyclic nucleotide-binding-like protein [Phakopsora pachyrhizi]
MSLLPSGYAALLNELNRDVARSAPSDPLQFCASWFNLRLEAERIRARASSTLNSSTTNQDHINQPVPLPPSQSPPPPPPLNGYPAYQFFNPHSHSHHHHHQPYGYHQANHHHHRHHSHSAPVPFSPPLPYFYHHHHHPHPHPLQQQHYRQLPSAGAYQPYGLFQPPYSCPGLAEPPHPYPTLNLQPPYLVNPATLATPPNNGPVDHQTVNHQQPQPEVAQQPLQQPHPHDPHLNHPHQHPNRCADHQNQSNQAVSPSSDQQAPPRILRPNGTSLSNARSLSPSPLTDRFGIKRSANVSPSPRSAHDANNSRVGPSSSDFQQPQPQHRNLNNSPSPAPPSFHNNSSGASPRGGASQINRLRSPIVNIPEEDEADLSDDDSITEPIVPTKYNFGRRVSVSAESLTPSSFQAGPPPPKTVIPKSAEQRARIEASIRDNLLFRNLDEEQYNDVLNAMSEVRVAKGTEVIRQGAVGDFFYVVEAGTFDVYVRGPPTNSYVPQIAQQGQGTSTNGVQLTNPFGGGLSSTLSPSENVINDELSKSTSSNSNSNGKTLTSQGISKKVHSYGPGGSFGELALMYNAPRAATVIATSPSATLWALDRVTFRSILMEHTFRKRKMYENFLSEVPILVSLSSTERSKIADSLEERSFNEGIEVIKEGEAGREFFIIESGRAEVSKKRSNGEEEVVGILGKGDHFGELALLNSAPRAATVRAAAGSGKLKVAALGEKAFTRLLGPVVEILSRHAESHYGNTPNQLQVPKEQSGSNSPGANGNGRGDEEVGSSGSRVGGNETVIMNGSSGSNGSFGNWAGLASVAE